MEILNMDTVLQTEESFNEDIKSKKKRKYEQDEPKDDEVVWIPKPKPKIEIPLESNQSDEEEVVLIGETNNPLSTMPHPRHLCINHPFSLFNKDKNNHKTCPNCYCFVCDVPAISCEEWEVHQNARDVELWNGIKKERNLLLSFNLGDPNPNYPGVAFSSSKKKWRASYFRNGSKSNVHIGFYNTEKEALYKSLKYSFRYIQLENKKNDLGASWDEDRKKWKATNYFQKELLDLPECWYATQSEAINKSLLESFNKKKKKGLIRHCWKPFYCPIIDCTKRYVCQRPCANHSPIWCYIPHNVLGRKRFHCPVLNCNYGDNSQKRCVFHPEFLCYEPKDYID